MNPWGCVDERTAHPLREAREIFNLGVENDVLIDELRREVEEQ